MHTNCENYHKNNFGYSSLQHTDESSLGVANLVDSLLKLFIFKTRQVVVSVENIM